MRSYPASLVLRGRVPQYLSLSRCLKTLTFAEALHLQAMEGNPLDAEDIAMFEMFEREDWPQERRISHLRAQVDDRDTILTVE